MTDHLPTQPDKRLDPRRAELAGLGGLGVQFVCTLMALILANMSGSLALQALTVQAGVGLLFWLVAYIHLRLQHAAEQETQDIREAERRRKAQGVDSLFDEKEQGLSQRNLALMDRYVAPASSAVLSLFLLIPMGYLLALAYLRGSIVLAFEDLTTIGENNLLVTMAFSGSMAFAALLMGAYAAGLSRSPGATRLRAGAGYQLGTAVFFVLTALAVGLASKGWLADWPDRIVAIVLLLWMTIQSVEILTNFILDFYRPRVVGIEPRPAYDSRISGLLAEPQGLFQTFAHTMDYQFGFKISETWFFRFLEKAFAPLVLIQLITLYLLTCFVVIHPGDVGIRERWGAPAGIENLPDTDADWNSLPPPLEPALYLKWPWPVETIRVVPRDTVQTLYVGFKSIDENDANAKASKMAGKTVSWDQEHVEDEYKYLMPLPEEMLETVQADDATQQDIAADVETSPEAQRLPDNALYISGMFTVEYSLGHDPGDAYRYAYNFLRNRTKDNATATLRALFERELTAYLAGAQFWDVMIAKNNDITETLRSRLQTAVDRHSLGLNIMAVYMENVHPPVGEVGTAFQEVLQARQKKQEMIYDGEIDAKKILGLTPSQRNAILAKAEAEKYRKVEVARARAERFKHQNAAFLVAPSVYTMRLRLQAIEEAIEQSPLIVHPPGIEVRVDRSKLPTPEEMEIQRGLMKQAESQR